MIREKVFEITGAKFEGKIETKSFDGVYVKYDGKNAVLGFNSKAAEARAHLLLAKGIKEGKGAFEISQKPVFKTCGVMLDVSRGGVATVAAVKKYLDYMATLGMNMLQLYTEDIYEVDGYPFFGYQRGRYSLSELREIDDYAYELGIEVIPCIQTLGHLMQYLNYPEASEIRDTASVLLVGEEKTYRFIEACVKTMRKAFRSNRINIGCDETRDLGLGTYLKKNGYRNRYELINEHVTRVCEICKENGYHPMMWSDMYFALSPLYGPEGYALNLEVPQEAIDGMPDADMVFWNYYRTDNEFYAINIEKHKKFNRKTIFAGGLWMWDGFVPYSTYSYDTMKPALEECIKGGIDDVLATVWSGDGCESIPTHTVSLLPIFSEYCWRGIDCKESDIYDMSEFLTGINKEIADATSSFFMNMDGAYRPGKLTLWSDPLINLLCYGFDLEKGAALIEQGIATLEKYKTVENVDYYIAVLRATLDKCRIHTELRAHYKAGDRAYLKRCADEILPQMICDFKELYEIHKALWRKNCKPQGFEVLSGRYGATITRMEYAIETINLYLSGDLPEIGELEPDVLRGDPIKHLFTKRAMQSYLI